MKPMPWELLVTDGHVRAARLRGIATPFLIAATAFLAAGISWRLYGPQLLWSAVSADTALNDHITKSKQAALKSVAAISALNLSDAEVVKLPSTEQLPGALTLIRDGLRTTDQPPSNLPIAAISNPADFWSGKWPSSKIAYLDKGDLRAFGVAAASKPEVFNQTKTHIFRWLAVFRKDAGIWDDVAIQLDGFVVPNGEAATSPEYIPVSLEKLGLPEPVR